jgi:hypothetical protein
VVLQDLTVAPDAIDEEDVHAIDPGRAADFFGDLRQRNGEIGRAQQFFGRRRHRFQELVAAVPVERGERAGERLGVTRA